MGRPNAGKSTLTNALVGQKIVIASSKPQTTRHALQGVANRPGAQIVFLDTPGIHKAESRMNRRMMDEVEEALHELDEIHGLIRRIREEELPDGRFTVRYRFVYSLYQEACYASLAPTRKAALSARLAEVFLTYYGN